MFVWTANLFCDAQCVTQSKTHSVAYKCVDADRSRLKPPPIICGVLYERFSIFRGLVITVAHLVEVQRMVFGIVAVHGWSGIRLACTALSTLLLQGLGGYKWCWKHSVVLEDDDLCTDRVDTENTLPSNYVTCYLHGQLGNIMCQMAATQKYAADFGLEVTMPQLKNDPYLQQSNGFLISNGLDSSVIKTISQQGTRHAHLFPNVQRHGSLECNKAKHIYCRMLFGASCAHYDEVERHGKLPSPDAASTRDGIVLFGNFLTSCKYFQHNLCVELFSEIFAPERVLHKRNEYAFDASTTVSLHIRRGDTRCVINCTVILPEEYYHRALLQIMNKHPICTVVVVSDSMDFAKTFVSKNLQPHYVNVIFLYSHETKPEDDLRLMAACGHHIVSNSTFAFWGAYMAIKHQSIPIRPQGWFRWPYCERIGDDVMLGLYPEEWHSVGWA